MKYDKNICTVCNYIYDEALGEPRQNIPSALKFDDLSDEWTCPECNSAKEMFQFCSCVSLPIYEQTCVAHSPEPAQSNDQSASVASKATPVGLLVAERPARASVLEAFGIDYCCGGKTTLEDACRTKGVRVEEVLDKLLLADQQDDPGAQDWTKAKLNDLVEHIITSYHEPLRKELSRVALLAEKVARVHGVKHPEMAQVRDVFNQFKAELELHMQKEEMILFPGIVSVETTGSPQHFGCDGGIEHPIEVMGKEHDDAGEALRIMRQLTNNYAPPADACNTFKVMLFSLSQIESEMHQHVHKENNILFPRALELSKSGQLAKAALVL
ncbi:MAG: iron-sulfur cluster repair di-iron protein [Candidatus Melainabacteria bacterium]|nr:iron-sulfur cluster repair di-iron protein [Candidatus Melainabacteria bacterium]